jgi:hypothetical protein
MLITISNKTATFGGHAYKVRVGTHLHSNVLYKTNAV